MSEPFDHSGPSATLDGYIGDSLYPSNFHVDFAPPNIDAMLAHAGIASPRPPGSRAAFTMADIGCGDAAGLILNAVAHPEAHFIGIDGNPGHIERGRALAATIGVPNIELHCSYFDAAIALHEPGIADYVQCQGVLSWVGEMHRASALALAAHLLKPGGALGVGYNCLPGWLPMFSYQQMVRALADGLTGTPEARFAAAHAELCQSGLIEPSALEMIDKQRNTYPAGYFAHEYLNTIWRPIWSGDMVDLAGAHGMSLVGQARASRLRPDFAYKAAWRETLAAIANPAARESASDILTNNWFRTDIFVKRPARKLDEQDHEAARLAGWWMACWAQEDTDFTARTSAGTIRFDNLAARTIIAQLQLGPRPLEAIGGIGQADLFNTIDALFMANAVRPVSPPAMVPLAQAADAVLSNHGAGDLNGAISAHGAVSIARGALAQLTVAQKLRLGITR